MLNNSCIDMSRIIFLILLSASTNPKMLNNFIQYLRLVILQMGLILFCVMVFYIIPNRDTE